MMPRRVPSARNTSRSDGLDLSRKTSLVPRGGFFSRGVGLVLRTRALRLSALVWRFAGFPLAAGVVAALLLGTVGSGSPAPGILVLLAAAGALLVQRLWCRLRRVELGPEAVPAGRRLESDLQLGMLSVVAVHVVLVFTGGLSSPLYPLIYLVVALVLVFHRPAVGLSTVGFAFALEGGLAFVRGDLLTAYTEVLAHGGFIAAFATLHHLALSGFLAATRTKAEDAVQAHLRDRYARARDYRLIVSRQTSAREGPAERDKSLLAAVQEVEKAVRAALEVAATALGTHTVAVYLLTSDEKKLVMRECISDSGHIARHPLVAGEGLPGVVLHKRSAIRLQGGFRGAVYYDGGEAPRAFLGVPLIERGTGRPEEGFLRGVLIADRVEERPFTEADEEVLEVVGRQVLRAIDVERVMANIRKAKDDNARFYDALKVLNKCSKPAEVFEQVVRHAVQLAPVDLVAVTVFEDLPGEVGGRRHEVVAAGGPGTEGLVGLHFDDNAGLVAQAIHQRSALPGRDFHMMERTLVFTEAQKLKDLSTLKVLPMFAGDEVVGTLVCGAIARDALSGDDLERLNVLGVLVAGSLERARLFEQTERLATIDGLTGLNNHRRFQERFDEELAKARRYERPVSLLLADVDHFKLVNDTYGHPIGDRVLKGLAAIFRSEARDTDIPARYGGEELTLILPETDHEGAQTIANRIRKRVEDLIFHTELGPLKVTLSIGVSTCSRHGDQKAQLIEAADQALYAAKNGGRNRVVSADVLKARPSSRRANA